MRRVHRGFTIIELMIVLAIAGVLASMALPGLQDWVKNSNRASAVNNLLGSLHGARSEAIKRNKRIGLCPTATPTSTSAVCLTGASAASSWAKGWIMFEDDNSDFARQTSEELIQSSAALSTVFTVKTTESAIIFHSSGRMEGASASTVTSIDFTICDDRGAAQARVVSVSVSGRPQSATTTLAGAAPTC